jgi:hypothetical protein
METLYSATLLRRSLNRVKLEAYTALLKSATRLAGARRPLAPAAEFHHQPNSERLWNESYYFNFFDSNKEIAGWTRIGKMPNQNSVIGVFFLYQGHRTIYMLSQNDYLAANTDEIISGGSSGKGSRPLHDAGAKALFNAETGILNNVGAGVMRYEIIEPLNRLRIVASGQMIRVENPRVLLDFGVFMQKISDKDFVSVDVDLTFSGLGPVYNFKNIYARGFATRMIEKSFTLMDMKKIAQLSSQHYEQTGAYHGSIKIGEKEVAVQGTGQRDHSWGLRDYKGPEYWRWLTMQFGSDLAVVLNQGKIGRVDIFTGYIARQGRHYPFRRGNIETKFEQDGLTQKYIRFQVEDITGFKMEVEGQVINPVPLTIADENSKILINEALTEYRWQGRSARGISEYGCQIH